MLTETPDLPDYTHKKPAMSSMIEDLKFKVMMDDDNVRHRPDRKELYRDFFSKLPKILTRIEAENDHD